ncbi:MAG: hypothetical protein R6U50_18430 [Desulfobacterales bacterium]
MTRRNVAHDLMGLLFGIISTLLVAVTPTTAQADLAFDEKERSMNLAYRLETESAKLPPIDAAVPQVLETAYFGLG